MNKKLKRITAILMSALIISSVATLTACTDKSDSDKSTVTESSTEPLEAETEASTKPTEGATSATESSTEPTEESTSKKKSNTKSNTNSNSTSTSAPKFETKTETIVVLTPDNQATSTEQTETLRANNEDGIYVEGVFPEGAMLTANFVDDHLYYGLPITNSLYWYEYWFDVDTADEISKFYHSEFTLNVWTEDWEHLPVKLKAFVPYEKPNCHIVYFDNKSNPKEIPSEYIDGKYVFYIDPTEFEEEYYNNFHICTYGETAPNAKPVQQTLTDEETGITVSGKIPPDTHLTVVDYSNTNTLASDKVTTPGLYYITLINGHKEITPNSALTVTIPGEADNKVGYYHHAKFINRVWNAVEEYSAESVDPCPEYNPVVDENDTKEMLTYINNTYNNNSYTITTSELGLFGVGTKDKLNPEYLCRVDKYQPQW
ncbi:MAG: hypothetical protein UHK60_01525 [Acutalibacteraceae bacterium]|nr:hypothetical protein [Acutalibacteraceae bacterium]